MNEQAIRDRDWGLVGHRTRTRGGLRRTVVEAQNSAESLPATNETAGRLLLHTESLRQSMSMPRRCCFETIRAHFERVKGNLVPPMASASSPPNTGGP
jgi:hypothetical protein